MENSNLFEYPNGQIAEVNTPYQGSSNEDLVRRRIIRQSPSMGMSAIQLENPHYEGGVQVKNRFQHRDRSLSLIGSISKRKKLCQWSNCDSDGTPSSFDEKRVYQTNSANSSLYVGQKKANETDNVTYCHTQNGGVLNAVEVGKCILDKMKQSINNSQNEGCKSFCKSCGESNSIVLENNIKRCKKCNAFSLAERMNDCQDFGGSSKVESKRYEEDKISASSKTDEHLTLPISSKNKPVHQKSISKRKKEKGKVVPENKVCLTISSDEGEESGAEKESISEMDMKLEETGSELEEEHAVTEEKDATSKESDVPKISDRMKLQGCKVSLVKGKEKDIKSSNEIASNQDEIKFDLPIGFVKFGALDGIAISQMLLVRETLSVDIECSYSTIIDSQNKISTEKYKLALGSIEVMEMLISDANEPLLICIVPTVNYAEIVNGKLEKNILDPRGNVLEKRQIVFSVGLDCSKFKKIIDYHMEILEKISTVHRIDHIAATNLIKSLSSCSSDFKNGRKYVTRSGQNTANSSSKYKDARTMFVYPPPPKKGGIAITTADIDCLNPGVYLNDSIIDFYLKFLVEEKLDEKVREKTYLFNSYFYTTLTKKLPNRPKQPCDTSERMHCQVKKWTRNVDIFEKDYIIIPVNEHAHWYLVMICFPGQVENVSENSSIQEDDDNDRTVDNDSVNISESTNDSPFKSSILTDSEKMEIDEASNTASSESSGRNIAIISPDGSTKKDMSNQPCILMFDSLVSGGRSKVFSNLRLYLTNEWKEKRGDTHPEKNFNKNNIKGSFPKIPLQNNDCDCGVYILQFAESFFKNPITNYKPPIKKQDWFTKEVVENKRDQIKNLIFHLEKEYTGRDTKM